MIFMCLCLLKLNFFFAIQDVCVKWFRQKKTMSVSVFVYMSLAIAIFAHRIFQLVRVHYRLHKRLITMISLFRKQNFSSSFAGYQSSTQQGILCHVGHSFKQARYGKSLSVLFYLFCRLRLFWDLFCLINLKSYFENLSLGTWSQQFWFLNIYLLVIPLCCVLVTV